MPPYDFEGGISTTKRFQQVGQWAVALLTTSAGMYCSVW